MSRAFVSVLLVLVVGAVLWPMEVPWATFPGSNGRITFSSFRDGRMVSIYVMNPDGSAQTRLTDQEGMNDYSPTWSPDGSKVAFHRVAWSSMDYEIYVMNVDGTGQTNLTNNPAADESPTWSPDGRKIAFVSSRDGNIEIYVMNADGSNPTRLTNNWSTETQPAWSPDGSKIAFVSYRRSEGGDIYVMNAADGSGEIQLTSTDNNQHPDWSPDGSKIIFMRQSGLPPGFVYQVFMMNADGTSQTSLTGGTTLSIFGPVWSPDQSRIAFELGGQIYTMNPDGSGQTNVSKNQFTDSDPDWQPVHASTTYSVSLSVVGLPAGTPTRYYVDGTFIGTIQTGETKTMGFVPGPAHLLSVDLTVGEYVCRDNLWYVSEAGYHVFSYGATTTVTQTSTAVTSTSFPGANGKIAFVSDRGGTGVTALEIYVMNADGSGQTRLTNNAMWDDYPAWSPDGSKIAFARFRQVADNFVGQIYVMNADGSGQTNLSNNAADDYWPTWSPDGSKIAFRSYRDSTLNIYVMNSDGSSQYRLTTVFGDEPSWSPDGSKIAFLGWDGTNFQIFVVNADGSGLIQLTDYPGTSAEPSWSPDGSKIAFSRGAIGTMDEVYVMNADGSSQTNLTNNPAWDDSPSWSPDGSKILFCSGRDQYTQLYVMNTDGSGQTPLTNDAAAHLRPDWQPVHASTTSTASATTTTTNVQQTTTTTSQTGTTLVTLTVPTVSVIRGTIYSYDVYGNIRPLAWAQVTAISQEGISTVASSNVDGTYVIWVAPGTYNVTATSSPDFIPQSATVIVPPGWVAVVDLQLQPSGPTCTTCTVTTTQSQSTTALQTTGALQMQVVSNSTVSALVFDSTRGILNFTVSGPMGTYGFFDATIAKTLLLGQPIVLIDGIENAASVTEDSAFWFIHVTYSHSQHHVTIGGSSAIPEFPSFLLLTAVFVLVMAVLRVRRRQND